MTRSTLIRTLLAGLAIAFVAAPRVAGAQRNPEKVPPHFTKVWESDSLSASFPALSPDGRWIVFGTYAFGRSNLWVIPANGGAAIALTTGAHVDGFPSWFPSGDKIAFVSDRTEGVMVVGFNPKTGHAVGTPRRVTLEKADRFALSTKGDRIAFIKQTGPSQFVVRLIPATGGPAITLGEITSESVGLIPSFSPDDRYVYFTTTGAEKGRMAIVRVPVSGGRTETVVNAVRSNLWAIAMPARQQVLQPAAAKRGAITTFSGDTIALFDLGGAGQLVPTRDGLSAFATTDRTVAPLRLIRTSGETRDLTAGRGYDWPHAWSADGKRFAYFRDDVPNRGPEKDWTFEERSVDGTSSRALRLRPTNIAIGPGARPRSVAFSPDLRYAAFQIDSLNRPDAFSFVVVDVQTGVARAISSRTARANFTTGNGNWESTNHGEFIYAERNGEQLDIRAAKPSGETRLMRSIPADARSIAVEGDEVAFARATGDSTTLYAAHGPTGDAKVVTRLLGNIAEIAWSPDAKQVAATIYGHDAANKAAGELAIIPVNAPGKPRFIPTGDGGYEGVWTRDGSAVFYLKADKGWTQMSVWRYPVQTDGPAENITKNETSMIWGYVLSPDGSSVLVPPERSKGVTLWRIDLQQAIAAYRPAKGRDN